MDVKGTFEYPVEFQTDIVSYLLKDIDTYRRLYKYVMPSYFTEYQLRDIISIMSKFFKNYSEIPNKSSMLTEINKICLDQSVRGIEDYQNYLDKIYEFDYNEKYVSDNLVEFIKIQAVYKALKEAYPNMDKGNLVLELVENAVKIGDNLTFDRGYNYKDKIDERIEYLNKNIRTKNQVPISMLDIDNITSGGLGSGELGVIIGKPGEGKSIFLCNVAVGACMIGKNVVYFTLEANEDILAGRVDGSVSKYTLKEMKSKTDKLKTAVSKLKGNLVIKAFPSSITTVLEISNYINDLIVDGFKPDLVIIDYIGIVSPISKRKELRHSIGNVCKEMIAYIADKYEIPVWSAHQSSDVENESDINKLDKNGKRKENMTKVRGIESIAEAKVALAAEVTLLLTLNQNSYEKAQKPQGLRIFVPKNRVGPDHGIFNMTIDKERFIIAESDIINMPSGY